MPDVGDAPIGSRGGPAAPPEVPAGPDSATADTGNARSGLAPRCADGPPSLLQRSAPSRAWLLSDAPWAKPALCLFWGVVVCLPLAWMHFGAFPPKRLHGWSNGRLYVQYIGFTLACFCPFIAYCVFRPKSRTAPSGQDLLSALLTNLSVLPLILALWGGTELLLPFIAETIVFLAWNAF